MLHAGEIRLRIIVESYKLVLGAEDNQEGLWHLLPAARRVFGRLSRRSSGARRAGACAPALSIAGAIPAARPSAFSSRRRI
ncbi:hypothetical protein MPLB_660071 [Mesorhizobium sp. ORS 3324]|nr:hypothetical protein MPLB_660071 [Mesorhizobium sp. ORS 3324]